MVYLSICWNQKSKTLRQVKREQDLHENCLDITHESTLINSYPTGNTSTLINSHQLSSTLILLEIHLRLVRTRLLLVVLFYENVHLPFKDISFKISHHVPCRPVTSNNVSVLPVRSCRSCHSKLL